MRSQHRQTPMISGLPSPREIYKMAEELGWEDGRRYSSVQDAVTQNPGGIIYFPGTFVLADTVVVEDGATKIVGLGPQTTFQCDTTAFTFQPSDPLASTLVQGSQLRSCRIQFTGSTTDASTFGLELIKQNRFWMSDVFIFGYHQGIRLARCVASELHNFQIGSPLDITTSTDSAAILLDGAANTGGTFSRTISTRISNFYLNGSAWADTNNIQHGIRIEGADGVNFSNAYIAGTAATGINIQVADDLSLTGQNHFHAIYIDGVNQTNSGVVIEPGSGSGTVGSVTFGGGSIFANFSDVTESVCFDVSTPVGFLAVDKTVRLSNADVGVSITGDDGSSNYRVEPRINSCTTQYRTNMPRLSQQDIDIADDPVLTLTGGGVVSRVSIRSTSATGTPAALDYGIDGAGTPSGLTEIVYETGLVTVVNGGASFEIIELGDMISADVVAHFCKPGQGTQNATEEGHLYWDGTTLFYTRRARESEGNCVISSSAPFGHDNGNLVCRISNSSGSDETSTRLQVKLTGVFRKNS